MFGDISIIPDASTDPVFIGFVNCIFIFVFGNAVLFQLVGSVDVTTGADLSIQVTVAVVSPVLPAAS